MTVFDAQTDEAADSQDYAKSAVQCKIFEMESARDDES